MFKSVQIKMILIIIALAVVMLAIPEYIYLARLNNLNVAQNPEMLAQSIATWKIVLSILTGSFLIISTIIVIFTSKNVVSPISKLIKKVERIAAGDETEQIELKEVDNGKSNTEIDELVKAFNVMTAGLKENLNEVTRQKMQIETILLHMTDGIIAFNIDGSIIHINPAASRLLKITADDNTFDKIFKKLKIDMNMEKIIYLENWTSTEQKVNIDDTYVNMFFAPFKDENNRPAGVMVLIQDITEHVRLDNMRKEFVADVSHELKTPLTSILGYSETLATSEYE